jgi:D-alanyl-D-alanine carboxypeptidase (penicillin-binding protein 5/6)
MRFITLLSILWLAMLDVSAAASEQYFSTKASNALIMDYQSGTVLYEKNARQPMPPASMSKLMTLAVLFDAIKAGEISLDTEFYVSERAWRTGGSKMFVLVNTRITVRNLISGIIVDSGNDACIVVAENMASPMVGRVENEEQLGTVDAFVTRMNAKAAEWGLNNSSFANPTGLPDPEHLMSAYDLALLAQKIIRDFPEFYSFFNEREFTWSDITQSNRNPLLGSFAGADGLKTGHTDEAGYGVVGSAIVAGRRRIIVINGLDSMPERAREGARMMRLSFSEFETRDFFFSGDPVGEAEVAMGKTATVPLKVKNDISFTLHKKALRGATATIVYQGPLRAPIAAEQQVGILRLEIPGQGEALEYPLYTAGRVREIGFMGKLSLGLGALLTPPSADELN